ARMVVLWGSNLSVMGYPGGVSAAATSAAAGAGVRLVVNMGQVLEIKVSVNLRCGQIGVPQQLLDPAQVVAGFQQVRGEGMPEQVRVQVHGQPLPARMGRQ